MRLIHFADLHIGVETYGRPLADRGWSSRMQDFLDAFDALVEYAIGDGVDAVIFAGDAYKSREPTQTQQREFARRIRRLSEAGIATFLLVGNHDLPNAEGRAHVLEIYRTLGVPNVYVGDTSWFAGGNRAPVVLETRSGPLQVASLLPWPQVSRWLADNPQIAGLSIDRQMQQIEEQLTKLIAAQADAIDPALPAILACHVSINDFLVRDNPGSEQWMTVGTAPTLLKSALCDGRFDYIALGHHHNNMDLGLATPCWYSGSLQRVDFGEERQPKGFMVFDLDQKRPLGKRIGGSGLPALREVDARRFVTVVAKPKIPDPVPEVCAAIARAGVADAIVRVEVHMNADQNRDFRVGEVRRALEAAHTVAGIRAVLPEDERRRLPAGVTADAASPLDTLDIYFRLQNVEEQKRARLRRAAEDLLATADAPGG